MSLCTGEYSGYLEEGVSITFEKNREPSYTIRIHPIDNAHYGDPVVCWLTAEPHVDDPKCCHLKAIRGEMPNGSRLQIAMLLISWGYESASWERQSDNGPPKVYKFTLKRFLRQGISLHKPPVNKPLPTQREESEHGPSEVPDQID